MARTEKDGRGPKKRGGRTHKRPPLTKPRGERGGQKNITTILSEEDVKLIGREWD